MKKGINVWSFPGEMTIEACIGMAREAGFDAIELALNEKGQLSLESTEQEIRAYRQLADDVGIEIASLATGLYWKYSFTSESPEERQKALEIARFQMKAATWLGVNAILVVPGCVGTLSGEVLVSYDVAYERALAAMKLLAPEAEKLGVVIGIENVWNKFLLSPLEMRSFIDEVGSPFVQAYFDAGNCLLTGYPEHWIPILGKRIVRVHIKDFKLSVGNINGFVDLLAGNVNFPAVMEELRRTGYEGYICAEMSGYSHYRDQIVFATSSAMDRIMEGYRDA